MQATLFDAPSACEVFEDLKAFIIAHRCDLGHGHLPRYPKAPDVFRVYRASHVFIEAFHLGAWDWDNLGTCRNYEFSVTLQMMRDGRWCEPKKPSAHVCGRGEWMYPIYRDPGVTIAIRCIWTGAPQ
jgi:hypothetical protein